MPRRISVPAYSASELKGAARERAYAYLREAQGEPSGDGLRGYFRESLEVYAVTTNPMVPPPLPIECGLFGGTCEVGYSLGYCQGDGANWTGRADVGKLFEWLKVARKIPGKSGPPMPGAWPFDAELLAALREVERLGFSVASYVKLVSLRRSSCRYEHSASVLTAVDFGDGEDFETPALKEAWHRVARAWALFVVGIGDLFAERGYALIEECHREDRLDDFAEGNGIAFLKCGTPILIEP